MKNDLFGDLIPTRVEPTYARMRPSLAEEKAELALKLGALCKKVPGFLSEASVQGVRAWLDVQKSALKMLKSPRASAHQLQSAISAMERWSRGAPDELL